MAGPRSRKIRPILKTPAGEPLDVLSISPSSGSVAGGTTVTITVGDYPYLGEHDLAGVSIGGVAATNITRVNARTITAVTGAHASALVPVAVTTSWGTGRKNGLFSYAALSGDGLLQENGDNLLLETGDRLLLE